VQVRADSQAAAAAHPETAVENGIVGRIAVSAPHQPASGVMAGMQAGRVPSNMVSNIPLDHIDKNPYQTRYLFDPELLEELADSIRVNGVVQPVVVRPAEEHGRYVLILGERRCRASKMAGKESVPAIVRQVSQQQAAEMTVIENLQRQDLNCLEQAEAFRLLSKEFNLTQEEIGARVGMSRESVSNYMRLLRLPEEALQYLANGQIGFSEARQMLSLEDATKIPALAEEIVKKHMSVEQIEMIVSRMNGWSDPVPGMSGQEKGKAGSRWQDPNVRAAQLELERTLGVRVRIRDKKGKGKILIEYSNVDDYERVVGMLRGNKG
jgi:ParB family chromosome partitioning protein